MQEDTFIKITHKDVYEEVKAQRKILEGILEQAKLTNGRVTKIESKSLGLWISNHPFKFATFTTGALSFLISDLRVPIIEFITSIFL